MVSCKKSDITSLSLAYNQRIANFHKANNLAIGDTNTNWKYLCGCLNMQLLTYYPLQTVSESDLLKKAEKNIIRLICKACMCPLHRFRF